MSYVDKKNEVINKCLETFVKHGLHGTTSRILSSSLDLQNSGFYYYFKSKDEAIIICAKKAAEILSDNVMFPTIKDFLHGELDEKKVIERASKYNSMMNFLIQSYTVDKYREQMTEYIIKLNQSYINYSKRCADERNLDFNKISPFVSVCITMITNLMIFGDENYVGPQVNLANEAIKNQLNKGN